MKCLKLYICFFIGLMLVGCHSKSFPSYLQTAETALANPIISVDSVLFVEQVVFSILPSELGSQIRYATNGEEVTLSSSLCSDSLVFSENMDVQFKAFHSDFNPSETLSFSVRKVGVTKGMDILEGATLPKAPYEGNGLGALRDMEKGMLNFRANEAWLGFQSEVIEFRLVFDKSVFCEALSLSILVDHNSWIFAPSKLELVSNEMVIAEKNMAVPLENQAACFQFIDIPVGVSLKEATLKVYMDDVPDWHAGKGTVPWLFVDEVFNVSMSQ